MMLELTTQGMFNGLGRTTPPAFISILFNTLRIPLAMVFGAQFGVHSCLVGHLHHLHLQGIISFTWYLLSRSGFQKSGLIWHLCFVNPFSSRFTGLFLVYKSRNRKSPISVTG